MRLRTWGPSEFGRRQRRRAQAGNAVLPVLLLLAVVCGAGGYNYWRNLQVERAEQAARPYADLQDAEVSALLDAYRSEVDGLERRYRSTTSKRARGSGGQLIGDHVRDFDRAAAQRERVKSAASDVAGHEAAIRELEAEQARRAQAGSELALHLKRLTTL